ncbi:MAG: acyltransferase family protein [Bacteroidaceae bacterium]|nr:acyltransferase family protein [Bacteroidaceae bacterium]
MNIKDTTLLKGLGILLIITHNYMHWLPECVAENEYTFSVERIDQLCAYLAQGGPHVLLNILSHFGHYGVAIFLFLSGYGLVRKYESSEEREFGSLRAEKGKAAFLPSNIRAFALFLLRHAVKLWRLMVPAVLLFMVMEMMQGTWNRPLSRLFPLLGFYSNLQPHRDLILGPWWWFGLMMQFYLLWRLLLFRRGRWVLYLTMSVCVAVVLAVAWTERGQLDSTGTLTCYLHYNFPPSMLAFGLGVADARYGLGWLHRWWSPLVGMAVLIVGSFNAGIWCVSSVGALMVALAFAGRSGESKAQGNIVYVNLRQVLIFLGTISAWLFALHPVVREYTIDLAKKGNDGLLYLSIVIYLGCSVLLAWVATGIAKSKKNKGRTQ